MTPLRQNNRTGTYCLPFFLLLYTCSVAQLLPAQSPELSYLHFTRHNFLSTNQVNCILEDKKSFKWLGTSNGIQRFDGNRWLWLKQEKNDPASLPDNYITNLLEDKQDRLWVQTLSVICLLNRDNFQFTPVKIAWAPEHTVYNFRSLTQLKDGNIWLTLVNGGLYRYDETSRQFVSDGKIIPKNNYRIYQLIYDSSHRQYYMGTDKGIVIYDTRVKQFYDAGNNPAGNVLLKISPAQKRNVTLYLNDSAQLWFSTSTIHSCYDIKKNTIIFCDSLSKIWGVLGYTTDRSGTTWSYGSNIAKMDMVTGSMQLIQQTPDELYGISFRYGYYLLEDKEHNYWLGTNNGLFIYNRFAQQFISHKLKNPATGEIQGNISIQQFIELPDHSILALSIGGDGLYHFDQQLRQLPLTYNMAGFFDAKEPPDIRCGLKDRDNHIWIAGRPDLLLKLYPETGRVEKIKDSLLTGISVYSMTEDKNGNLWFGTFNHTIIRRDAITGQYSKIITAPSGKKGLDNIYCLYYDGDKYIWAGSSESGLLKINTSTNTLEKNYLYDRNNNRSIPTSRIKSVIQSSYNELMMSTPLGIVIMDISRESFRLLNTGDGLPDNNVTTLLKGENRNIWFASDNGISRLKLEGMRVTSYGILEGLTNEVFNEGAVLQLHNGHLLVGNENGFTSFNPSALLKEGVPDNAEITGIKLYNNYLNTDSVLTDTKGLVLKYRQNFLTIEFSNMSLLGRYHTDYFYQLEGVDKDWVVPAGKPEATYTYLPPGHYTFKVKCKTKSGTACETVTSLQIRIIPPYWKQWWFYSTCLMAAVLIIYLVLHTRYKRKIEAEQVRSRIARDLHDDMGSTLSTINILSEMTRKKIDSDIPAAKKFIRQISDNTNRIMESMDDIVWNINPTNDNFGNVLSRMREFAGNLFEARGINHTFKEDELVKHLTLELGRRHDFFMIFKEAVNNLAKYSACTSAAIEIEYRKNNLSMTISDNGTGFDVDTLSDGNGLINMKRRAKALDGKLTIASEPGKGTTLELKIPV